MNNTNYKPTLVIGVTHNKKSIRPVCSFLEDKIISGMNIGTETYAYPLTHIKDHWSLCYDTTTGMESEFPLFFDAIGDYVTSKGGIYTPLQDFSHFKNSYLHILDPKFVERYFFEEKKLLLTMEAAGINTSIDPFFPELNPDIETVVNSLARLKYRLYKEFGIDYHEYRDDALISYAKKHRPEYVIVGLNHVPAFMAAFLDVEIKIIR